TMPRSPARAPESAPPQLRFPEPAGEYPGQPGRQKTRHARMARAVAVPIGRTWLTSAHVDVTSFHPLAHKKTQFHETVRTEIHSPAVASRGRQESGSAAWSPGW